MNEDQQKNESKNRKIIHIDMDAFYASVEQRDNPSIKGKPVIVGGMPDSRGVVSTCSYEARKFGIHSAMPSSKAYRLCPNAIFLKPNFKKYKFVSKQINQIFHSYTDMVEPLSLDEAFLDVTINKKSITSATIISKRIRYDILSNTGLTASAGVSFNKFLAKVASDINKPNGTTVITPDKAQEFIETLPIRKFFGIGKVTEKKMYKMGINTGYDLRQKTLKELIDIFGKNGLFYYNIVRGIDNREVNPCRIRKSIGKEVTLKEDINDLDNIMVILGNLCEEINEILKKKPVLYKTLTLKLKYHDFTSITRNRTFTSFQTFSKKEVIEILKELLIKTEYESKTVRLIGTSISNFEDTNTEYYQPKFKFSKP